MQKAKKNCSISHRPIYVQAFHIASIYINSLEKDSAAQIYKRNIIANSCTQLYVCLYHMILVMSFLYFQWNIRAHAPWTMNEKDKQPGKVHNCTYSASKGSQGWCTTETSEDNTSCCWTDTYRGTTDCWRTDTETKFLEGLHYALRRKIQI